MGGECDTHSGLLSIDINGVSKACGGTVSIAGACGYLRCDLYEDAGSCCINWSASIAPDGGDECVVTFTNADGSTEERRVPVTREPDSDCVVWQSVEF